MWSDLVELCGSGPLTAKARGYLAAGRPLQALHLIDIVVGVEPQNRDAREAELRALEMLFDRAGVHYDDTRLLELEIKRARAQLARTVGS